jgi:hypothetical protein
MNMNEIVCPNCQKAFKVDESGYTEILKQVHDKDFEKQLAERISALKDVNTIATELAVTNAKTALENDEISWSRYKSYTQILEGDEEQYRADIYDAERRASDETRK